MSVEDLISWVLRTGVVCGAAMTSVGFFVSSGLAWAGVLILILTPFMRVAMAGAYFLSRREYPFFFLAAYVIMMLVIGSLLRIA